MAISQSELGILMRGALKIASSEVKNNASAQAPLAAALLLSALDDAPTRELRALLMEMGDK